MRIQLVLPGLSIGGTEKMVAFLARGLKEKGHEVQVISLKQKVPMGEVLQSAGVEVITLDTPEGILAGFFDMPRLFRRLKAALHAFKPDVVQSFLTRANVLVRSAANPLRPPKVVCSLRVMEKEKRFHLWAERLCHPETAQFTVNSDVLKRFAIEFIGLKPEQVHVIYNGVEPGRVDDEAEISNIRNRLGLHDQKVILSAGRLHRQKGFDVLLQSFRDVLTRRPDSTLLIAGEGEEHNALQSKIRSDAMQGKVLLLGLVKNLSPFFRIANVFVLSSRWEGTPNVVLESMRAGCPDIATKVGGVPEILSDPGEGWIVAPEDPRALAQALEEALSGPDQAAERARNAAVKVQQFSMDKMVNAYASLYQTALQAGRVSS
jgi:glycosyltransferase involved in cell wall biosynthesis